MSGRFINEVLLWFRRVITQPREELNRWQQAARFAWDLGRFGARQLQHDRAPQMAAALAFRALFGLVPVLVVATVLVRAVIGVDEFVVVIGEVLGWVGLDEVRILNSDGNGTASMTLADWMSDLITEAAGIRLSAIGWMGLAVLSYASVTLLSTIENVFNTIYRINEGRPWSRRVPLYWFLLTMSPIALGLATWLNGRFEIWLTAINTWPWAVSLARQLWIGLAGWGVMLMVYQLMPNADVKLKPAAIGALVAIIILELGKRVVGSLLQNALSISQLYGSLGLIPLFMFWTYLMWLAVLFGLQVSAILQKLRGRRLEEIEQRQAQTGLIEPACVISVMDVVADRFSQGLGTTPRQIADTLLIPRSAVQAMIGPLISRGFLHRLDQETEEISLARPAEQITASELIDVGFAMVDETGARRPPLFERLRDAQRDLAAGQTLANL